MTIDMSTTRTDLALESVQAACSGAETGTISGVRSRERTREGYAVTDIRVEDEDGAQALGKPVGRYVTVDLGPYFRREADYFDRGVRCLAGELAALLPDRQYAWLMRYERFGMLIIMALVCFGALSNVLDGAIGWVFQLFCRIVGFY